jgi:hypothetical protein
VHAVRLDFAHSTQTIAWIMAAAMLAALIVTSLGLPSGRPQAAASAAVPVSGGA